MFQMKSNLFSRLKIAWEILAMHRIMWKYINTVILMFFVGSGVTPVFLIRFPDLLKQYWWIAVIWDVLAVFFGIRAFEYCKRLHESGRADRSSRSPFEANSPTALIVLMIALVVMGMGCGAFIKR